MSKSFLPPQTPGVRVLLAGCRPVLHLTVPECGLPVRLLLAGCRPLQRILTAALFSLFASFSMQALALPAGFHAVQLRVAGREVNCSPAAVADANEVYIPMTAVYAVGATQHLNEREDASLVRLPDTADRAAVSREIAVTKPVGSPMLPLSEVAKLVDGVITRSTANDRTGAKIETVRLLAKVLSARFATEGLSVTTSFPVPFHVRTLKEGRAPRSFVDCVGAVVADDFQAAPLPADNCPVLKIRAGQFAQETARVVAEFQPGAALSAADNEDNRFSVISATLVGATPNPAAVAPHALIAWPPGTNVADASRVKVTAVHAVLDNDSHVIVTVSTSATATAYVHYDRDVFQLAVDIPRATLVLDNASDSEQKFSHPLLAGLHVGETPGSPGSVRVTMDTVRVTGFTLNRDKSGISLDLRLPRGVSGSLSDKLIVVDAGHGGTSSGATYEGRRGKLEEKDITLAIALKVRDDLEACGARVVMTRDRDVNVALADRPRLANNIHADLFLSIHNDSNGAANSASGTSTYYHKGDPSGRALAQCVQECVRSVTGLPSRGALSDGILYQSGLAVLRESKMPAALCEVAYINNDRDRAHLVDSDFQKRVAQAMCNGLRKYVEGKKQVAALTRSN